MPHKRPLKSTDHKLRLIEEKLGVGVWTWDLDTSEVTWSAGLFRILGMDPGSVIPSIDLYQSLVHPDDQIDFDDGVGLSSDKRLRASRFRIIRPDGSMRWLLNRAQPHFDRSGQAMLMIGVIQDVTEDEELRVSLGGERKFSKLLAELIGGWVWRAHPNGKLIETADWMKLTGQSPQDTHDWEALAAIHPDDRSIFREAWQSAIANGRKFQAKVRVKTVEGIYVQVLGRALPQRNTAGEIDQWVGHNLYLENTGPGEPDDALLDPGQIRAARALLDWSAQELAEHSDVSFSTIRRMEQSMDAIRPESLHKVRSTFERSGVLFSVDGDNGVTVTLKRRSGVPSVPAKPRGV